MRARALLLMGLVAALASCGGDGVVSDDSGPPPPGAPTLSFLQASLFTPRCALPGCHVAPSPQQGLELSDGATFPFTVGIDANELSTFKRVAPGNAADSYLYMKLAGDPRVIGGPMPGDGTTLTATEIDGVRQWIDAGALDN